MAVKIESVSDFSGSSGKRRHSQNNATSGLYTVDSDNEHELQRDVELRLLQSEAPEHVIPTWVKYYDIGVYIACSLITLFSFCYLAYIGWTQAHIYFRIQYDPFILYLEFNSYSVLCPLLCPICMMCIIYRVKTRTKPSEGDFYGFLGIMLLLILVGLHDLWGLQKYLGRDKFGTREGKKWGIVQFLMEQDGYEDHPPKDQRSRDVRHWQYAWSTKIKCARNYVKQLTYKFKYSKTHVNRKIAFYKPPLSNRYKRDVSQAQARQAPPPTPNEKCNEYHDMKDLAKTREWMQEVQKEFKCCGPYGYKERIEWFDNPSKSDCKKEWIHGCHKPLIEWLQSRYRLTAIFMGLQVIFYVVSMFIASIHHSAMKEREGGLKRTYSLLNMDDIHENDDGVTKWWQLTRPSSDPVKIGTWPPPREPATEPDHTKELAPVEKKASPRNIFEKTDKGKEASDENIKKTKKLWKKVSPARIHSYASSTSSVKFETNTKK